jgi:hypothetical protein
MSEHPAIGKHGEYEPRECAVTGQWVQGRHATAYSLKDGFYFRILTKAPHDQDTVNRIRKQLMSVLSGEASKSTPSKKEDKQS